jgi:carboxyl-terminal processing protease
MEDKIEEKDNNKEEKSISFNLIEVLIIILMTSLLVAVSTGIVVYKNYGKIDSVNSGHKTEYLDEFEGAYYNILNSYVEKVDEKGLLNAAIQGMYNYLGDPYTGYLDEDARDDLTDRLNGYKGIGVEITKIEEGILVITVFKEGPAALAGLEPGDVLVKINGKDVTKSSAAEAQNLIKNTNKDKIELTFLRAGITKTINVDIKKVDVPTIESNKYEEVGYIKITSFSNKTSEQFKKALENLEKEGITSLVIDVRNNGGGYLNAASEIAELFIEKGKNIYGLESKNITDFYKDSTKESRNYKVGVLMNSGSASASEILASALKESYNATLIGTTSYGKGTVQETSELTSGGMIKYTTAYWLTPNGNKINGIGLKPDVEINGSYYEGMTLEEDTQLQTAINTVK